MAAYTTIDDPGLYFNSVLYTGNGTDDTGITGVGFQPDLVWNKGRDETWQNILTDSVRGATKNLYSDASSAEVTDATRLQSFDSNGFTIGTNNQINENTDTYVAWNWKESATAGLDIVSWTGDATARTISHNLSAVPKMMICKNRDAAQHWGVYHATNGNTKYMRLNSNIAATDANDLWNNTTPTSSVFSIANQDMVNANTNEIIGYIFAEKQGFSKFGSFIGNANVDGPFCYTGFKPALVITKRTDSADSWIMGTNKILGYNSETNFILVDDTTGTESTTNWIDFYSNGFKIIRTDASVNASGGEYSYIAFAEQPFVNSNGVPCNAR